MTRDHLQSPPRTVPSLSIGDSDSLLSNLLLPDERAFLTAALLSRTHEAHASSGRTHCSTRPAFTTPWRRWPHAAVFWMHETTAVLQQTSAAKAVSKEMDAIRAMVDELSRSFDNLDRVSASHRPTAQSVVRGLPVALRRRTCLPRVSLSDRSTLRDA
jgi:hypothetical protein